MSTKHPLLKREKAALLVIDVQEKLYPHIDRAWEVVAMMCKVIRGCQLLDMPIEVTEQYPQGLGSTIDPLRNCFPAEQKYWPKNSFSCLGDESIREQLLSLPIQQWVIVGFEAHVCVLQTAKSLLNAGKEVVVINDAISSRSIFNFSTAIAEMREEGARISCAETVLFELTENSKDPQFKAMGALFKSCDTPCTASSCCCF